MIDDPALFEDTEDDLDELDHCEVCGEFVEGCDCLMRRGRLRPIENVPTGGYL